MSATSTQQHGLGSNADPTVQRTLGYPLSEYNSLRNYRGSQAKVSTVCHFRIELDEASPSNSGCELDSYRAAATSK
ncbi:hypothetical protein FBZ93_1286 [Bradyrhizobium macuxiense]|uniref:Uncharacterized protein n=1 Tax=Bradyrhizobium macuxiense TaxID=1755647 RepID=A0A560KU27_9BRAD|nr:hypothetical protein FBZ93_1286 [Bradyrhizobium macuxiense]